MEYKMQDYSEIREPFYNLVILNRFEEKNCQNIKLENKNFIRISNIHFDKVFISDFIEDLKGSTNIKFICFDNCIFDLFVFAEAYTKLFSNKIDFVSCTFKEFRLDNINEFFNEASFSNYFLGNEERSNTIDLFNVSDSTINEELLFDTQFFNYSIIVKSIIIQNSKIKKIKFLHQSNIKDLKINNSKIETFELFNSSIDSLKFKIIKFNGIVSIKDCNFNKQSLFDDVTFEEYVNFSKSKFNGGLNLDNTSMEKNTNFKDIEILNKKETSQETYRIIKDSFERIGNKIEANKYHSLELSKFRQNIWDRKQIKVNWILDGVVMFFHWISSNHSTNWLLVLFWIFVVSLFTNIGLSSDITTNNLFKFLNVISDAKSFNGSYYIMTLNKISLGYLYYQFIVSIRRNTIR